MKRALLATFAASIALCAALAPRPAASADLASVRALIKAAGEKAHSMRIQIASPLGFSSVATIVRDPLRMHMRVASGPLVVDMYFADGYLYQRVGDSGWRKQSLPNAQAAASLDLPQAVNDAMQTTLGDDVSENGVTYGTMTIEVKAPALPGTAAPSSLTMICTYDKRTYLTHDCKSELFTETFDRYDDPANTVTLPPELASAVDAGPLIVPQTAASPSPAPAK